MDKVNLAAHNFQRVALFIDTQNLYHSARSNYRANVNYHKMLERAVNGRQLVRAFAYVIRSEERTEEKFFDAVQELGIEIRIKDLQVFHTGAKKGDWDVGIDVDMIRMAEKVDVIVLASGDGDFLEVMRYCQSRGVRVEIMAFEKTTNAKLQEEADLFIDLGIRSEGYLIGGRSYSKTTQPAIYPREVEGVIYPQNRLIKPVVGMPARPNTPEKVRRAPRKRVRSRNLNSDNVFGNRPPTQKTINPIKPADDQNINWFGRH